MGTTQSLEELESGAAVAGPYGAYLSHKRPRTLSRGSSADGEPASRSTSSKIRSVTATGGGPAANKKAAPETTATKNATEDDDRPSPPIGEQANASAPPANGDGGAKPQEGGETPKTMTNGASVGDSIQSGSEQQPTVPPPSAHTKASPGASTGEAPRSRQRPRHPDTKPPDADELQRLMDKSRAMKEELEAEEAHKELAIVEIPHDNDVLLGRGRRCTEHPGNVLFREFVRCRREEYNRSWKYQKQEMAAEIVHKIQSLDPPGRFLELLVDGKWKEVTKKQALEKASQAMREKKWIMERPPSVTQETPTESDSLRLPLSPADSGSSTVKQDPDANASLGTKQPHPDGSQHPPTSEKVNTGAAATSGSGSGKVQDPPLIMNQPAADSAPEGALAILSSVADPNALAIKELQDENPPGTLSKMREGEEGGVQFQEV